MSFLPDSLLKDVLAVLSVAHLLVDLVFWTLWQVRLVKEKRFGDDTNAADSG